VHAFSGAWALVISWKHWEIKLHKGNSYENGNLLTRSTADQDNENQLRQLRDFCQRQDWELVTEYVDIASGGKADREQFNRMFQDASQRRFDLLLFWSLDRLSREGALETLQYLQRLTANGVAYRSFTEQYLDSLGPFREAVLAILAVIAKQEHIRLSERTKAGLGKAKAHGHFRRASPCVGSLSA
jgi:DNA invertase Pin-like site-specific DNA recombinase